MRLCCELNCGIDLAIKIPAWVSPHPPPSLSLLKADPDLSHCPSHKHFSLYHWGSSKSLQRNGAGENAFTQHCCWVLCIRKPWPEPSSSGMLPHTWPKGQGWLSQNNFFLMNSQTLLIQKEGGGKGSKIETWKEVPPPPLKQTAEHKS